MQEESELKSELTLQSVGRSQLMRSQETTNFNIIVQFGPKLTNKRRNPHVPVLNLVSVGQPDEIV